jgi:N-acyl-D-aspartate/D-glutamate deacylase
MMPYDLCIRNALLADETGVSHGALGIRGGAIAAVFADAPDARADETIDAHVHFS